MDNEKRLFSVAEVAHIASVSEKTVRRLIDNRAVQTVVIGSRVLIPAAQVDLLVRHGAGMKALLEDNDDQSARYTPRG